MLQALLLAIWAGLCTWDQFGPHLGFRKPLLASVGVGIILGDMTTAIMIGATMELMWLGVNNIGAYVPPDVISGTIVGAALGIMGGARRRHRHPDRYPRSAAEHPGHDHQRLPRPRC